MSNHPSLGKLAPEDSKRDAIHVAVISVIASETLAPGTRVGITYWLASSKALTVGVVDPFLPDHVQPGQRFWLVLDPHKVTNLRHDWDHPMFPVETVREAYQRGMEDGIEEGQCCPP